jgi:gamma-glutamyltranspeptidase/glutathione hydrolase
VYKRQVQIPDFFNPAGDPETGEFIVRVAEGRFSKELLDATGWKYREIPPGGVRINGEGVWIGISRDPATGIYTAASHPGSNSASFGF